jgi:hypothetical protein
MVPTPPRLSARVATPLAPPAVSRRLQGIVAAAWYADLAQAQRLHVVQHALVVVVAVLPPPQLRQHTISGLVFRPVCLLLLIALSSCRIGLDIVVEQRGHEGIGLRASDRGATRRTRVRMDRGCGGGLEGEPFLQTCAAEGVKAVEQRERLVEQVGADLTSSGLAGASRIYCAFTLQKCPAVLPHRLTDAATAVSL